ECIPASSQQGYSNAPEGRACDTGLLCQVGGVCNDNGACGGTARVWGDGLDCTTRACQEGQNKSTATIVDRCALNTVRAPSGDADPKNVCQVCNPAKSTTDWSAAQVGTPCSDGDSCTDDVCDGAKKCQSTPKDCNDPVSCTIDSCDSQSGQCVHMIP